MASVCKSTVNQIPATTKSVGTGARAVFENVSVCQVGDDGLQPAQSGSRSGVKVEIYGAKQSATLKLHKGPQFLEQIIINNNVETAKVGGKAILIASEEHSYMFCFSSIKDMKSFESIIKTLASETDVSVFKQRTDESSAEQYFQFYGYMSQQQNMMQDYIRTSTYQRAMLDNLADFQDKVVLDVGAGSGILSFFAAQAGARKVYAIEASSMAQHCQTLVKNNGLEDKIVVIAGKIEEVEVPELVDIIISEPMGYMLFNERMLETYLHAKKWLKPGGKMFPSVGELHIAPFTDETLYMEQCSKANFWYQPAFHSVDLTSLREAAVQEYFRQPIVDTFDVRICLARTHKYRVDFETAQESDLYNIDIPLTYTVAQSGTIHGLAFWFDVAFNGSQSTVWLSTAPTQPLTHWYQVRCLLQTPIFVKQGQKISGKVLLKCNKRQSYDVEISLGIPGTTIKSYNLLDLKNPFFRYTGQPPQPPPGTNTTSPSDSYWNQVDTNNQAAGAASAAAGGAGMVQNANALNIALLNGGMGDGAQQLLQQIAAAGGSAAAAANGLIGGAGGQQSVVFNNLVPLGNIAPVHPGSIPSPGLASVNNTTSQQQQSVQSRTSVGAGISPNLVAQSQVAGSIGQQALLSNQYMIGDYMIPSGTSILPQSVGLIN